MGLFDPGFGDAPLCTLLSFLIIPVPVCDALLSVTNLGSTPVDKQLTRLRVHVNFVVNGYDCAVLWFVCAQQVADLIAADPRELVFTSGATEANNMAIKGVAHFYGSRKRHVVTSQTEHKCVLDSCRALEAEGFKVTYLPVDQGGIVDLEQLEAALQPDTALVSIMFVNNEIGVIQRIAEIGALCRSRKVFFHTDAAQAVGKIPIDVNAMNIDLMSISGHKIYGPKGVGALYVRRKPRVRLEALFSGGGQERGLRSGTLPAPLCVGMGAACDIAGPRGRRRSQTSEYTFTQSRGAHPGQCSAHRPKRRSFAVLSWYR